MKDVLLTTLFYSLFLLLNQPLIAQTQSDANPVLIEYGSMQIDRREFELDFEMVMVLKAVESGVPIKSQNQIMLMQQRYLDQRAKELVLTDVAAQRGISLTEDELDTVLDDFMRDLGFSGASMANFRKLGLTEGTRLRAYLHRRTILTQLIAQISRELSDNDKDRALEAKLDGYYADSGIRTYPEYLQRPLGE